MSELFIERAAAVSPLGLNLNEMWQNILTGKVQFGKTTLPGERNYFSAETKKDSASDIHKYGYLFYDMVRSLISELNIQEPVDAIFFATAVGNLANIESKIYSRSTLSLQDFDFTHVKKIFLENNKISKETHFVCIPTGCCAGLQAIGLAKSLMGKLKLKSAIIMSLDFGLSPLALESFKKINATATDQKGINQNPSRPFCKDRGGFLFADGGGAILVKTESFRNIPRITGYGCVSSAFHMTDISTDGESIKESINLALKDAKLDSNDIDHINLHASGTQQNDEAEYNALLNIIGNKLPDVSTFKGNHGHALGGANMIEVALSWKILEEGIIPPTPETLSIDAYNGVNKRDRPKPFIGKTILKTASGFSGIHASLVMEK